MRLGIFRIVAYNVCISFNIFKPVAPMNPVSTTPPNHQQLYEIAEQQAGYFTAAQAQAVGFSRPLLSYYTKVGRFSRREVLIEHQLIVDDRNTFGD
jgi:hypothetical protein